MLLFGAVHLAVTRSEALWRAGYLFSTPSRDPYFRLEATLRTMGEPRPGIRRVFLTGSSQTREGIDTPYLNRAFRDEHVEFHNLGISGGAQPIELAMIEDDLFERRPDMIVHTTYIGSFFTRFDLVKLRYHFDPSILPWLHRTMGYPRMYARREAFLQGLLSMASPIYRYRGSLRRIASCSVKNAIGRANRTEPILYAYQESRPPSYFIEEIERAGYSRFQISAETAVDEALFERFVADIQDRGIEFILIEGPTHPLIRRCYSEEVDAEYRTFLADLAGRLGFEYLSETDLPAFTNEDFIDFTHLNERGRATFTRFLEAYLRERDGTVTARRSPPSRP